MNGFGTRFAGIRRLLVGRRNNGPCPHCIPHSFALGESDSKHERMFRKWLKRPPGSYALYWRFHKEEYRRTFGKIRRPL